MRINSGKGRERPCASRTVLVLRQKRKVGAGREDGVAGAWAEVAGGADGEAAAGTTALPQAAAPTVAVNHRRRSQLPLVMARFPRTNGISLPTTIVLQTRWGIDYGETALGSQVSANNYGQPHNTSSGTGVPAFKMKK
jgi:hypothetical protein